LLALLFAIGCGDGGGGGGSTDSVAAIATAPIDLPPGQTTAQLAWTPSEGEVVGYLVFQSNQEEDFGYLGLVNQPKVQITGKPGDSIRILVVAKSATSTQSAASPPSPPVRFHAAVETAAAVVSAEASAPALPSASPSPAIATNEAATQTADVEATPADEMDSDLAANDFVDADADNDNDNDVAPPDQALPEQLMLSDLRFPLADLSPGASRLIQSLIDAQVGAGVSLAGSGELDGDEYRELVWLDASGQLFVSEGARIATTEDLPSTFVEAIRLRTTERFVGLADFDGDGAGDWIVEDTATGDVWMLNDESQDARFGHIAVDHPDLRLVGHGDFDGDGRAELLWQHTDLSFQLGWPGDDSAVIDWIVAEDDSIDTPPTTHPMALTSQLLSVADLNGDGRDDLLFRGLEGRLELALSVSNPSPDSSAPQFEWISGPATSIDGLELVATFDLDHDGAAEIAWWGDDALQVWEVRSGI
jgi:hypothetical protein